MMPPNQRAAMEPGQAARMLRIVWAVMLFSLCLYVVVLKLIPAAASSPPDATFQTAIALLGTGTATVALYLRFTRIPRLVSSDEPMDDKARFAQLWTTHLLCFVLAEATALFGFALAFLHGDVKLYGLLYLGGVLLMLLCYPRLPANDSKR